MSINPNPRQLEVLIAIDASSVVIEVKPGASSSEPVLLNPELANEYITILAPREFMKNSSPDSNLKLAAVTGDVIRWRGTSFAPLRGGVLLVAFNHVRGQDILSKPNLAPVQKYTKVQRVEDQPLNLTSELYTDSRWEATCKTAGKASYDVTFAVIETGDQESTCVRGYYKWRTAIEITSS